MSDTLRDGEKLRDSCPAPSPTPAVSAKPGELPPGEILVRVPGQSGPAIGEQIKALASREKLHLFSPDGRKRIAF